MVVTTIWEEKMPGPSMLVEVFFVRHGEQLTWHKNRIHGLVSFVSFSLLSIWDYGAFMADNASVESQVIRRVVVEIGSSDNNTPLF